MHKVAKNSGECYLWLKNHRGKTRPHPT